jgi:hypothetical protein
MSTLSNRSQVPQKVSSPVPEAVKEHKKALQQYQDTEGHFSLVR